MVSGGLDSCVAAAEANARHEQLAFLHVSYGQRTEAREKRAFHAIADHFAVEQRLVTSIDSFGQIGGSALTDGSISVPKDSLEEVGIPVSYVPFRNANLLSIAVSWAEVLEASSIYVGAVQEDSSGYPDCREGFFEVFNQLIREGTRPETDMRVVTPLIRLSKREIVLRGVELKAPLQLTWSCYQNVDTACGHCDSCLLRLRGFQQAGVPDPVEYRQSHLRSEH